MAYIKRGKICKRYDCIYHPAKNAANGCDYYLIEGTDRIKDKQGRCKSFVKATPEERRKFDEKKFAKIWHNDFYSNLY